jgi:hypothetical protein
VGGGRSDQWLGSPDWSASEAVKVTKLNNCGFGRLPKTLKHFATQYLSKQPPSGPQSGQSASSDCIILSQSDMSDETSAADCCWEIAWKAWSVAAHADASDARVITIASKGHNKGQSDRTSGQLHDAINHRLASVVNWA